LTGIDADPDFKARESNARHKRENYDFEVRCAVGTVNRVIHQWLLTIVQVGKGSFKVHVQDRCIR
jgi:hypothetical protein